MKTIITFLLLFSFSKIFSQCDPQYLRISFEDTSCLNYVHLDTSASNIWQIGTIAKTMTDSAYCKSKVITTLTDYPYPVNNSSSFTLITTATSGDIFGFRMLSGYYYVQTDSLKDFGKVELSLDKGVTWHDIVNDTAHANSFVWYSEKPTFTGHSFTCKYFAVDIADMQSITPIQYGDTIMYRFSFQSDSTYDNLAGLMFDNIQLMEFVEGVVPIIYAPIKSKIYPNPSSDNFTIEFENPEKDIFTLAVYDICSRPILKRDQITDNRLLLDTKSFAPGMYVYKLTNPVDKKRSWGRFVVTEQQ